MPHHHQQELGASESHVDPAFVGEEADLRAGVGPHRGHDDDVLLLPLEGVHRVDHHLRLHLGPQLLLLPQLALAVPQDQSALRLVGRDHAQTHALLEQAADQHAHHPRLLLVAHRLPLPPLPPEPHVQEHHVPPAEPHQAPRQFSLHCWRVHESVVVEAAAGEGADQRGHPVLRVQEVGTDAGVQEPFEERPVEEGDVGVRAQAGGRQLAGVPDQQHLLHPALQRHQQSRLRGLRSLIDDQAGDLPADAVELVVGRTAERGEDDLGLVQQVGLDLGVAAATGDDLLPAEGEQQLLVPGQLELELLAPVGTQPHLLLQLQHLLLDLRGGQLPLLLRLLPARQHHAFAQFVQTDAPHGLVGALHDAHPQDAGPHGALVAHQSLLQQSPHDVVHCCVRGRAHHDLARVPRALQVGELGGQQSHQGGGLARARRPLQQHQSALPQRHFPDGLPLGGVEDGGQLVERGREQVPLVDELRDLLVEQAGLEDGGRQLRVGQVGNCQVLPHVRGQFVQVEQEQVAIATFPQRPLQVALLHRTVAPHFAPQVLLGLRSDQHHHEGELLASALHSPGLQSEGVLGSEDCEAVAGEGEGAEGVGGVGVGGPQGEFSEGSGQAAAVGEGDCQWGGCWQLLEAVSEVCDALIGDQVVEYFLVCALFLEAVWNSFLLRPLPAASEVMLQHYLHEVRR